MADLCFSCAVLMLLGAFYSFAGIAATRATLTSYFMDWAIAGITMKKPSRIETLRTAWLLFAAFLILAGGISLLFRTEIAAWLFVLSALGQAFYIGYLAPRVFDAEDPPTPEGRRQTINAFIIYAIVTAGIAWAESAGHLKSFGATPWSQYAVIAVLLAVHIVYVASRLLKLKAAPLSRSYDDPSIAPGDESEQ